MEKKLLIFFISESNRIMLKHVWIFETIQKLPKNVQFFKKFKNRHKMRNFPKKAQFSEKCVIFQKTHNFPKNSKISKKYAQFSKKFTKFHLKSKKSNKRNVTMKEKETGKKIPRWKIQFWIEIIKLKKN